MRILVLGSGGREHAIVKTLAKDSQVSELHVAPGSRAMERLAIVHPDAKALDDGAAMVDLAKQINADLVVIGPEAPLVAGVADTLRSAGFAVFGPGKDAARIEGSKAFAKDIMAAAGVRTARAQQLSADATDDEIESALDDFGPNYVVKDDGLAGGKGVVVTRKRDEALAHIHAVHEAGNPVLLESFLSGPEISLFCLVDGETVVPLIPAQDHKRAYDNDEGPNTGGMGAYAPLDWLPADGVERIVEEVCTPVAKELVARDSSYCGLLYAGLAWDSEGPAVIEFNCRFGDPETQAVLALLESSLAEALSACAHGRLDQLEPLQWAPGAAVTVVMAAEGYPATPRKGDRIVSADLEDPDKILHAGTTTDDGEYYSAGGRVLNIIGTGADLESARTAAYETISEVAMAGGFYRRDIGAAAAEGKITL